MSIVKCIVETRGYPNYKDECRFYVLNGKQQIVLGPFLSENDARVAILNAQQAKKSDAVADCIDRSGPYSNPID